MRLIAISDTHNNRVKNLPPGDILIHAGDWSGRGSLLDLQGFCNDLNQYKKIYENIVVIAGNHDFIAEKDPGITKRMIEDTESYYLNDSFIEIEGLKIWGSPVQPRFFNWAFNRDRGPQIKRHWDMVPEDTNMLVTHGPPLGFGDLVSMRGSPNTGQNVGCSDLLECIKNKPNLKAHIFGHIHSGYGSYSLNNTKLINASLLDDSYKQVNKPIVFDL